MVKLVIEIECGTSKGGDMNECEFCHFLEGDDNCQYWCKLFGGHELMTGSAREGFRHHLRLPACRAAEMG
jgi:hypothetical protein